jgi:PmbA protein
MDMLQELASQAEQVEVVRVQSESTTVGFEANRLKSSRVDETAGVAVRVVKEGRLGFAASSDESALEKLMSNALESAAYGDEVPIVFPGAQAAAEVVTYDPAVAELSVGRMVEMGQEVVDYLLAIEPEARITVELERGDQRVSIRNQAGADVTFRRSPLSMVVDVSRVRGDDVLIVDSFTGTTAWEAEYMRPVRQLGERLERAKQSATIKSGRMPVLFAPTAALALALPLMYGLNGKNVYTGISPMKGKAGDKLFDDKITIVDDAALNGRYGSATHDDEGVAHRRNVLVDRGVLKGFLYDLKTAAQSGVESTGNGSRDLFSPPSPSPTNLIFQAGETPLAEMIAGMEEGLLVEQVLGLGQGNIISGAFSNSAALAFKVEKGEIVGRVKDVSIAGNVYELLPGVAAVSRETEWVYRFVRLPYVLLPEMNVVAKGDGEL